jgi:diacylglycerol kinase (ATP)
MTQPVIQLFINAAAGSASARRVAALKDRFELAGAHVIVTPTAPGPLTVAENATHACAVGGDGTLRHVAAAVRRSGRSIGMSLYPVGTVNLLARECGYRSDPIGFVQRVLTGTPRTHHHGLIGTLPFFTCASVGPDSYAVAGLSLALKRRIGRAAYGWSFLKLLVRWPRPALRIRHESGSLACEAVYIAKGRYFAGPWSFAPEATVGDPTLHVVALMRATRGGYARFLWALLRRQPPSQLPGAVHFTCSTLTIEGNAPVQADGDIVARLPVEIGIDSATLRFA